MLPGALRMLLGVLHMLLGALRMLLGVLHRALGVGRRWGETPCSKSLDTVRPSCPMAM